MSAASYGPAREARVASGRAEAAVIARLRRAYQLAYRLDFERFDGDPCSIAFGVANTIACQAFGELAGGRLHDYVVASGQFSPAQLRAEIDDIYNYEPERKP